LTVVIENGMVATVARERSPIGTSARDAAAGRAARSAAYRAENTRVGEYHGIAKLVVHRRTVLGISQRELARRVGTSEPAISRIESGRHATNVRTLRRVFKALGGTLVVGYELAGPTRTRELVAV
jgi:ribosome-binding protein aMBF1 (putative translation factor)